MPTHQPVLRPSMLCAALLAALLSPASAEPPRPVEFSWFCEGEASTDHDWSDPVIGNADYAACYSGAHLMCAKDQDPAGGAHEARFTAEVNEPGTYVLWIAATRPDAASPLQASVDGANPVAVTNAGRHGLWGPSDVFSWMSCAKVGLQAGSHTVTVGVTARRAYDNRYYAYLDALALERVGDDATVPFEAHPVMPQIGQTPIRFYSGNASVGWFMQYWGTAKEGDTGAIDPDIIDLLKRCGCTAMCDYLAWCRTEEQRGAWDWSFYRENASKLHAAGLQYNTFAWLHFPPRWFLETEDYVPYRCLEHGEELHQLSLWAPATLRIYDEFYRRMSTDLGEPVDFIRLAMPSEYGEIGYAVGMTNWLVPQKHVHGGYWCGDRFALTSFRETMRERFPSLPDLNVRWGTSFADWKSVSPPLPPDETAKRAADTGLATDRRRWLDFVDWYQDAWGDFAVQSTAIVRKHFPDKEIILSLGYGAEPVPWGNDQSRHIKRLAEAQAAAQTPGDIGYFATRRVSSACRVYGVPYFTEPPGSVDRERQVRRLFSDISNGTQTWFDYPDNLDGSRDILSQNLQHLTGQPAVCDVAFLVPSSWWWCRPQMHWPDRTIRFAEGLRDRMDYEVLDELLVRDGGLQKLGIRLVCLCEGDFLQAKTLEALRAWVEGGGILALLGVDRLTDIDGSAAAFGALFPQGAAGTDAASAWAAGRSVGRGRVVYLPGSDDTALPVQQAAVVEMTYRMSDLDPQRRDAVLVASEADGVLTTVFADRALMYNGSGKALTRQVRFREADFPPGAPRPPSWELTQTIPAHSIAAIPFDR